MLKKIKGWGRKHPRLLIASALGLGVLLAVLAWPREFIINGQVGESLKGQTVDLRLMRFSNQTSGRLLEAVDYDNVRTTTDGRFSLVHRAPLWRLPSISYLQICIKSAEQQASWDETLPVCAETPELSYPSTSNVKGATDGTSAVSCSRRQITGGLPGAISTLFDLSPDSYEFSLYCDRVYHNTGIAALEEVETYVRPVLVLTGNELSINGTGGVNLPLADPQELELDDNVLSITGGNSVVLPAGSVETVSDPATNQFSVTAGDGLSGGGTAELGQSLTLSSVLGISVDGGEVIDGSLTLADVGQSGCASGELPQWNGTAWVCTSAGVDTDDQTLSLAANILSIADGNSVNLAGYLDNTDSQTLNFDTGTSILSISGGNTADLSSLLDDTDTLASLSCGNGEIAKWNGSAWLCATDNVDDGDVSSTNELQNLFLTVDATNGSDPVADSTTDILTLADGAGITITGDSGTDTINIAAVLGATIESSEVTDGTLLFADLASNGCLNNEIIKFNGSVWFCGTDNDTDTTLNEAQVEAFIFDGDNTGTLSSGTLALDSLSYSGTVDDANVNDALTISAAGSVADGALSANVSLLGASVESGEITNGTILFADLNANGCLAGEIIEYDGANWLCGTDNNSSQNLFETIAVPNGTNPVADSTTDTLTLAQGAGITITGDSGTDTVTLAAVLGTAIDSPEITDGTITSDDLGTDSVGTDEIINGSVANTDLANSSLTVTSGSGLTGGGSVALGGSTTINIGAGNGIVVNADDITVQVAASADGLSSTTSSGSGMEVLSAGVALLQGCADNDILKWNETTDVWTCSADNADDGDISPTNELQNLFLTIDAPNGTDPAADTTTDVLVLADGAGITITGNSGTDSLTIAAVLGTSIDTAEITDGTITADDLGTDSVGTDEITNGTVANADLANSSLTITSGTGLTGGGSVALGGSTTLNIGAGNGITVNADDITVDALGSADGLSSTTSSGSGLEVLVSGVGLLQGCADNDILKWDEGSDVWECATDAVGGGSNIFLTIDTPNGTDPVADSGTDTLTLAQGAGITITGDSGTDTVTLAAVLGTAIDSSEITDGTITSDDLGTDSVGSDEITNGTVANADLANSSLTVTSGSGLTGGGSISLGGSATLNIGAGNGITVNADDITIDALSSADGLSSTTSSGSGLEVLASGVGLLQGCANNDILRWNEGSDVWECFADADTSSTNELQNLFLTIDAASGSDPVADSTTDTLTLAEGAGISITGDSGTDTVTLAAVLGIAIDSSEITNGTITSDDLGTDSVGSDEITNGTVANADLANSSLTVTSGSGLTGGGSISLGGSATLNIGAGNGITVNADDIAIDLLGSADGLSSTTSSGSGLETVSAGLGLLQGCADNDILKWDETNDIWECSADLSSGGNIFETINAPSGTDPVADSATDTLNLTAGSGLTITGTSGTDTVDFAVTDDGLNFAQLSDSLSLDAATTIAFGANNFVLNLDSTGDLIVQDNGTAVLTILDNGAITLGDSAIDQAITIDNGTGTISIATDGDANTTNIGTGSGADTVTIGDANANVSITDAQWSISAAGAANFATLAGAGLSDCDGNDDVLRWDSSTSQFSCGTNRATFHNEMNGDYTNATAGFTDVDNDGDATDDIGFAIGANETWVFEMWVQFNSPTAADSQWQVTAPGGATCDVMFADLDNGNTVGNLGCGASTGNQATLAADDVVVLTGTIANGGTAGAVQLQFRQQAASGTSTIYAGSFVTAYRISGADYAETYYSNDFSIGVGMIVELSGDGPSQVKKAVTSYSDRQIGIVSTHPGAVIGASDGSGKLLPIALSGRVPIKLTTENGLPRAGDMVTASSSHPGYGMKATRSGNVVGQLMLDATDNGDGTAEGFVYVRHGYWQTPAMLDVSSVVGDLSSTLVLNDQIDALDLGEVASAQYSAFDQPAVDQILRGFSFQQDQLDQLTERVAALESSQQTLAEPDGSIEWSGVGDIVVEESLTIIGELVAQGVLKVEGDAIISGHLYLGSDSAGRLVVRTGETAAEVSFSRAYDSVPTVNVTPYSLSDIGYRVKDISRHGFTVELARPPDDNLEFGWHVTATQ